MLIATPSHEQMRAQQASDGRHYFSAALPMLLRKHGVVPGRGSDFGFVTRGTPWSPAFAGKPLVFEGPLHDSVRSELGLRVDSRAADALELAAGERELGELVLNRMNLRRIPSSRDEVSEPYAFVSEDPLWNASTFEVQIFEGGGGVEPVLEAVAEDGTREAVGVRVKGCLVFGVPLFDVAIQHHVMPPYECGYYSMAIRTDLHALESWALEAAARLFREHRRVTLRMWLWPEPYLSALTVRHDFDRPLRRHRWLRENTNLRDLLSCYRATGVRATWYWRVRTANARQMRKVMREGHEVALHTEAYGREVMAAELRALRATVGDEAVVGISAHGGTATAGYLGMHQIEWALEQELLYGEILGPGVIVPSQAVVLRDGVPASSELVLPAQHQCLDLGTAPDAHRGSALLDDVRRRLANNGHAVIQNHPDIHVSVLVDLLSQLELDDVWCATMAQVAEWTRSTRAGAECAYAEDGGALQLPGPLRAPLRLEFGAGDDVRAATLPVGTEGATVQLRGGEWQVRARLRHRQVACRTWSVATAAESALPAPDRG